MSSQAAEPPDLALVRVARPAHALLEKLASYDEEAFGPTGLRTYDLAVLAEAGALYLAYLGEQMVGSCQLLRVLDEPSFFYVVGFYVRPAWRGRGLGRRLLDVAAAVCKKAGAGGILLTVAPDNTSALALYRTAGFVDEAFVRDFYGEGEDRFILRWRFQKPGLQRGVS